VKVAIIGSSGQLGSDLVRAFGEHDIVAWKRSDSTYETTNVQRKSL